MPSACKAPSSPRGKVSSRRAFTTPDAQPAGGASSHARRSSMRSELGRSTMRLRRDCLHRLTRGNRSDNRRDIDAGTSHAGFPETDAGSVAMPGKTSMIARLCRSFSIAAWPRSSRQKRLLRRTISHDALVIPCDSPARIDAGGTEVAFDGLRYAADLVALAAERLHSDLLEVTKARERKVSIRLYSRSASPTCGRSSTTCGWPV